MELAAHVLEGEELSHFGRLLEVNIAQGGKNHGIAQEFLREAAAPGPADQLRTRFERFREEFGMAFSYCHVFSPSGQYSAANTSRGHA
ncbi:hypothetical protein HDC30_002448 [Pseudomonas sp. JAI115]|uniref:hypothetical protein n=1 Tax=Pseudomonas sp. JAI115 TaxID=2723061 RepID=UPI00161DDBD2|nr:hypothetical protein [Pseudomonas sp. JAI115]MBB6155225.1 hypothetical protein [Pseudomonas sp. JAI115]